MILFAGFIQPALAEKPNKDLQQSAKQAILAVQEKFRLAIINKDKETFKSLFYSDSIPWIAVFSDEMVNIQRQG